MNNKIIKTFILVTLLALLVGLASATDVSTDTASTPTRDIPTDTIYTDTTSSVAEDTTPTTTDTLQESVTSKQTKNKEITKEEKNKKTANPINVGNYTDLQSAFGSGDDEVTVNITSNITLTGSLTTSINNLIIEGNGFTINGSGQHRFLNITSGCTVTINNLTITNCKATSGGAIYNDGTLTIKDSNLTYNNATGQYYVYGGAIYNSGTLTIKDSNLNNNNATLRGGAIYNTVSGTLNITHSTLIDNNAIYGGAIGNSHILNITHSNLNNNNATLWGGAIFNSDTLTITHSTLIDNNANYGGAIYNSYSININGSNLTHNIAKNNGSAVYSYRGFVTITNNIFTNNLAKSSNGTAIIVNLEDKYLYNNTNANSSKYNSTIYITADYYTTSIAAILDNTFDDQPRNTTINISTNNTTIPTVNDTINITFELKDDFNYTLAGQTITVVINENKTILTTDSNGIASMEYKMMSNETLINATYHGMEDTYNTTNTVLTLLAEKMETKLLVKDVSTAVGKAFTINGLLLDINDKPVVDAVVNITVNGTKTNATTNSKGQFNTTITLQEMGEYQVNVTFYENEVYKESNNNTALVTASKTDTQLTLNVSNSTPVNDTMITITVNLTDDSGEPLDNQVVNITISEETFAINTTNGIASRQYTVNKVGTQTITATYNGDSQYTGSTQQSTDITVIKIDTKLTLNVSNNTPVNNTSITITATLTDENNDKLSNQQVILNINGKTITTKTNTNGTITQTYTPDKIGSQNITATYNGDSKHTNTTKTTNITVRNKYSTKTVTKAVNGTIGERLTLTATITDENNQKVTSGNLIFKINGVTIKDNGKLTGSSNPLKVKVTNGIATATITPDLNMVNSDKITASYIGTNIYNASTSTPASINISKRNATIEITTNKKVVKQGQVLTITAKIYDTTAGKKSTNLAAYSDEFVYFKINGVTIKDANGEMLKVKVVNGVATLNYTVPVGISCVIDTQTMTPKNHTIQVGFYNKNYEDIISNNPHFQVERSPITINLANATINNKTHTLSMKITIKDYLGNTVAGPNKCIIKVNGVTLKNGTAVMYYYTTDGVLNLKNIPVPAAKNYTSVEVITQDRLAYTSQRNTTTKIKVTN